MEEENKEVQEAQTEDTDASDSGGKNSLVITVVIIAVIALAGGIYFLSKKSSGSLNNTVNSGTSATASKAPVATSNQPVKEITVSGKEFSFSPAKLSVNKGDRVKLVFKNTGKMQHDFVIDEFSVATKVIAGGAEDTVEFTPTDSGNFEFYCSVGNHKAQGMKGTLEVK